jgi:hypothetical protein
LKLPPPVCGHDWVTSPGGRRNSESTAAAGRGRGAAQRGRGGRRIRGTRGGSRQGAIMEYELEGRPATVLTLIWDFSKAHRRLAVRRHAWGFQACQPLHARGVLGLGGLSYRGSRLGARLSRLVPCIGDPM